MIGGRADLFGVAPIDVYLAVNARKRKADAAAQ
jgi:hypothetical protein